MEKNKGFIAEFKEFISRGNVIDLAVGVIIGSAFTAIVTSLVNDIVMPIIGMILGGIDFTGLVLTIRDAKIGYGNFIQCVVNFLLIALVVFSVIKLINTFNRKKEIAEEVEEAVEEAAAEPSEEVLLLREIRDLLNKE